MPSLCLADFLFILHLHVSFPGCLQSFLASSILTCFYYSRIFAAMVISLAHHLDYSIITFSLLALFSLRWPHPCAGSRLFVISGRNNFSSLASSIRAYPHPAHKPSFTVRRPTSTFINHRQAPLLFSPRAWEELLIKNVQCSLPFFQPLFSESLSFEHCRPKSCQWFVGPTGWLKLSYTLLCPCLWV